MSAEEKAFLGTGWSFPPTFSRRAAEVVMVSGEADIKESLWVLFSTALGERVMLPEYGCEMQKLVFQNVTSNWLTSLETVVRQAILTWEPRVDVESVKANQVAGEDGLVTITVSYVVRLTNSRSNLVYPFYYREATLASQVP